MRGMRMMRISMPSRRKLCGGTTPLRRFLRRSRARDRGNRSTKVRRHHQIALGYGRDIGGMAWIVEMGSRRRSSRRRMRGGEARMRRTLGASTTCNRCCLFASSFNATVGPLYSLRTDFEELFQYTAVGYDRDSLLIAPRKTSRHLKPRTLSAANILSMSNPHFMPSRNVSSFVLYYACGRPEQANHVSS